MPAQDLQDEFVQKLDGHGDIASVVWFLMGDSSVAWISQPDPALDGLRPIDCLASPSLIRRLKSMLMRMPS
jgi:Protein of unknown function (DUF2384)